MKVFEIINEALPAGWSLTQDGANGAWQAKDPSGTVRASGKIKGNVLKNAEKWVSQNPGATNTTAQNQPATDAPNAEIDKPKPQNKKGLIKKSWESLKSSLKRAGGATLGPIMVAVLESARVAEAFMGLIEDYEAKGCDRKNWQIQQHTGTINKVIAEAILAFAVGGGAGALAVFLATIGGPIGWLAAAAIAAGGAAVGIFIAELLDEYTNFTSLIADYVTENIFKDYTGFVDLLDDALEAAGFDLVSCREAAGVELHQGSVKLKESLIDEEVKAANIAGLNKAAKDIFASNPKLKSAIQSASKKDPNFKQKVQNIQQGAKAKAS